MSTSRTSLRTDAMSEIQVNRDLSERQLVLSGFLLALFVGLVGGLFHWQFGLPTTGLVIWCAGAVVVLAYFAVPRWRLPIYLGWVYTVFPIGWVVSHVILAIVFYVMFTLIGLLMRMFGRDPMRRRLDPEATTYWIDKPQAPGADQYFHQY